MICSYCREPWDLESIHERIKELYPDELDALNKKYSQRHNRELDYSIRSKYDREYQAEYEKKFFNPQRHLFSEQGCLSLGARDCRPGKKRSILIDELEFTLGDDFDGIDEMLEDAESLGYEL